MLTTATKIGLGTGSIAYYINKQLKKEAKCCGIIGYIGEEPQAWQILAQGIDLLSNRGYDSVGITTINNGEFYIDKIANSPGEVNCIKRMLTETEQNHFKAKIGIGHTRWATCGEITNDNAHPHFDYKKRISLVHNGIIVNYQQLKDELISKGISFYSQTDTEVIANLIGYFIDQNFTLLESIEKSCQKMEGSWGLVIMHKDFPKQLIVARNGSPILIGFSKENIFVSSEILGFANYTNEYIKVEEKEIIVLRLDKDMRESIEKRIKIFDKIDLKHFPSPPFKTFFEEEIHEQPWAIRAATNFSKRILKQEKTAKLQGFDMNKIRLQEVKNLYLIGCGTSYHSCLFAENLFKSLGVFDNVRAFQASEFELQDIQTKNNAIIFVSQSGETADIIHVIKMLKDQKIIKISVCNTYGSLLTTLCDFGVYQNSGREIGVAATKTFTGQIVVFNLMALWFLYNLKPIHQSLNQRISLIENIMQLDIKVQQCLQMNKEIIIELANLYKDKNSIYLIGKKQTHVISMEIALKIKELTYIHAEAICSGELKHGIIALINSNPIEEKERTNFIVLAIDNEHIQKLLICIDEIKTRKAHVTVITNRPELFLHKNVDFILEIPTLENFTELLCLYPMQLLVLEICRLKNLNPDKPRNLAKTVTVDQ